MRSLLFMVSVVLGCAHGGDHVNQPPGTAKTEMVAEKVAPTPTPAQIEASSLLDIREQLGLAMPTIQSCYEGFLTAESHPSVEMNLVLLGDKEGIVHGLRVERIEPDIPGLVACFTPRLIKIRLPPSDEPQELAFPVKLMPTKGLGAGPSVKAMEAPPNQGAPEGAPTNPR